MKTATKVFAVTAVLSATALHSNAASVGVSFGGESNGGGTIDHQLASGDIAGVIGQTNWNNALGGPVDDTDGTLTNAIDDSAVATTLDVTWTSDESWSDDTGATSDSRMVGGWLSMNTTGAVGTVDITEIPYTSTGYDLYLYHAHDRDNNNIRFREANSAFAEVSFIEGENDVTHAAVPYVYDDGSDGTGNYTLITGLVAPTLNIMFDNPGDNRTGFSGFQIVESTGLPEVLTLEIDSTTGVGTIRNTTGGPIDLDSYEIASDPSDSLNFAGWNSLQDQDFEQNGAPGSGNGWEELGDPGALGDDLLAEFYLDGSSILADGAAVSLGQIYNAGSGVQGDVAFSYNDLNTFARDGIVSFVTGTGGNGDYNGDGVVDAADYVLWRNNLGAADESAIGNQGDGGGITASDYNYWKARFGNSTGSLTSGNGAVPEPTSVALLLAMAGGVAICVQRQRKGVSMSATNHRTHLGLLSATLIVAWAVAGSTALAAVTNDRFYSFGEDDAETGTDGGTIGDNSLADDTTLDSAGDSNLGAGTFADLVQSNGATYADVDASGGLNRPGASNGDYGVRFDGVDDFLQGERLGLPSTSISSTPPDGAGPINYDGISNRGFQFWARPDAAGIGAAQSLVADTEQHGVRINAAGNWEMQYAGALIDSGVTATPDAWSHLMLVRPAGAANGARLYVDGAFVAGGPGGYTGADDTALVVGANTGPEDGTAPGTIDFYDGVIDDLEMFVIGTATAGPDYGTFSLATDNGFVATALASITEGDLTGDNVVMGDGTGGENDDVAKFISNWRFENSVNGVTGGDLTTRSLGDLNFDGTVNFSDWAILRNAHENGASLNLGALLGRSNVPEPSALCLAALGLVGLWAASRRA